MIQIQHMQPFYTKFNHLDKKLRLVFAYEYFIVTKDEEVFHFIPVEGKEILINTETMQVENLSEVFVFQRGKRFIRVPLYQLLLISNVHEYLTPIIEDVLSKESMVDDLSKSMEIKPETHKLIEEIEQVNLYQAIDEALDTRNKSLFMELTDKLNNEQVNVVVIKE